MARVSQEHLDARRRQILDGARRSFTRGGFHATSMQDILKETGLSAGAVYRYFKGKDEIIAAVAGEAFDAMREAFAKAVHQAPLRPLEEVLADVLAAALDEEGLRDPDDGSNPLLGRALPQLMMQVWSEAVRSEPLREALEGGYLRMRGAWTMLIEGYQSAGLLPKDVPAEDVARTLMGMCQGLIIQHALFGNTTSDTLRNGLRALTSMSPAGSAPVTDGPAAEAAAAAVVAAGGVPAR